MKLYKYKINYECIHRAFKSINSDSITKILTYRTTCGVTNEGI